MRPSVEPDAFEDELEELAPGLGVCFRPPEDPEVVEVDALGARVERLDENALEAEHFLGTADQPTVRGSLPVGPANPDRP
jgi:hypothetical protein